MKESLWGYYLVILGMMVSSVMIIMSNMTTTNQQDYYLLKEITNAAMIDAIDYGYYRQYGETKINTEKFVENFVRRFGQSISKNNTYKIDFYGIYENPPRVSIKVTSSTGEFSIGGDSSSIDVVNKIDAILESNNSMVYTGIFYSIPYANCSEENETLDATGHCKIGTQAVFNETEYYNQVKEIFKEKVTEAGLTFNENRIKILNAEFLKRMTTEAELEAYDNQFDDTYNYKKGYNDMPDVGMTGTDGLATSLKDVKFTVLDTPTNGKTLSWSARYKCENTPDERYGIKKWRKNPNIEIGELNDDTDDATRAQYIRLFNEKYKAHSSLYSDTKIDETYEWTPYYKACMIGIKYKIDFYYDIS